jgi:hypothetical protein
VAFLLGILTNVTQRARSVLREKHRLKPRHPLPVSLLLLLVHPSFLRHRQHSLVLEYPHIHHCSGIIPGLFVQLRSLRSIGKLLLSYFFAPDSAIRQNFANADTERQTVLFLDVNKTSPAPFFNIPKVSVPTTATGHTNSHKPRLWIRCCSSTSCPDFATGLVRRACGLRHRGERGYNCVCISEHPFLSAQSRKAVIDLRHPYKAALQMKL